MRRTILTLALTTFSTTLAGATPQDSSLPFRVKTLDVLAGTMDLEVEPAAVTNLATLQRAEFMAMPLPDGSVIDVELERLVVPQLGFQVDGEPAPHLLDDLDLSVWLGRVAGDPDSEVAFSASQAGIQGWVQRGGELFHLVSDGGDSVLFIAERELQSLGMERQGACLAEELPGYQDSVARVHKMSEGVSKASGSPSLYECKIALETDYQLYQVFGQNLSAETAYVTSLLTWVSYRYEEQIGTQLTYPYVQFYTNAGDPWTSQDNGGNSIDLLFEFQAAWQDNLPAGTELAAFLSGAGLGGGVAWLPGLCNSPYNFSVSGNINGDVTFPIQVSPANWDFMVLAHELGHNFGSPHSHDYCPPLDECAPSGYYGQCQTQQNCTTEGTLMSYCHLCSGGLANVTTYFHEANAVDMRAWVESTCLPLYCPDPVTYCTAKVSSQGCLPSMGWNGHPTLGGLDDFEVVADQVHNGAIAIMIYGFQPDAVPFHGGTLCVGGQIFRTGVQISGGNPPPTDCSGTLSFNWTHAELGLANLTAGTTAYSQFWYRDGASPGNAGLTDGLTFTVCN